MTLYLDPYDGAMRLLALLPCLQVQESVTNLTQLVAASSNQHLTAPLEVGCQAGHVVPRVHTAEQESPRYVLFVYQTCCSGSLLCRGASLATPCNCMSP